MSAGTGNMRPGDGSRQPRLLAATALAWALLTFVLVLQYLNNSRSGSTAATGCPVAVRPSGGGDLAAAGSEGAPGSASGTLTPRTWQEVDALIRQPALRHGVQQKGGMPANWRRLLDHMTNRDAERHGVPANMSPAVYDWFAQAFIFNKTAGQSNAGLQSPVPPCHFYADHKYRIVYVRNTKTAGTSVIETLGIKENPMVCKWNPDWCYAKCKGKPACLAYLWEPDELQKAFANYTVFTFVRNPWARAISSWLHIHNRGMERECQDSFAKFAEAPCRYGAKCFARPKCCKQRFGWVLEHVEPQSMCLFDAKGQPSVDFIGRVEHAEEDLQELLTLINSRLPTGVPPIHVASLPHLMVGDKEAQQSKEKERRRSYAELYLNNTALQDVRSYYATDFDLLGYSRPQASTAR